MGGVNPYDPRKNKFLPDDPWRAIGKQVERVARDRELQAAIDSLNASQRDTINLLYRDDYDVGRVAAILGISRNAVRMREKRALERLRELIQ